MKFNPFTGNFDLTGLSQTTADNRYLNEASNLSDLDSAATARTNLGLVAGGTGDIWVEKAGDTITGDLIGTDFVRTRDGTITRDGDGYVSSVALTGGRTLTVTRDGNNYISSITDAVRTWTFTRNASNQVTSWAVT